MEMEWHNIQFDTKHVILELCLFEKYTKARWKILIYKQYSTNKSQDVW